MSIKINEQYVVHIVNNMSKATCQDMLTQVFLHDMDNIYKKNFKQSQKGCKSFVLAVVDRVKLTTLYRYISVAA